MSAPRRALGLVRLAASAASAPAYAAALPQQLLPRRSMTSSLPQQQQQQQHGDAAKSQSFIEKAKTEGIQALVGQLVHKVHLGVFRIGIAVYRHLHQGGFDSCIAGLKIDKVASGTVNCSITVTPNLQNSYGTLHGGAIAVLVDVVGTLALLSKDTTRPGVSVDIGIQYMSAAKTGDVVDIEGRVVKSGQKLGFTQVDFRRRSDGAHLASGTHIKAL